MALIVDIHTLREALGGLSEPMILKLVQSGTVKKIAVNQYDLTASTAAYIGSLRARTEPGLSVARRQLLEEKLKLAQIERAEREGKVAPVEQYAKAWAAMCVPVRQQFLGLPSKLAGRFRHVPQRG